MELGGAFASGPRRRGARCITAPRLDANAPTLTVRAGLIRYLRRGFRNEVTQTSGALQGLVENVRVPTDVGMNRKTLARLDSARALLDRIGLSDGADVRDLTLDNRTLARPCVVGAGRAVRVRGEPTGGCPMRRLFGPSSSRHSRTRRTCREAPRLDRLDRACGRRSATAATRRPDLA